MVTLWTQYSLYKRLPSLEYVQDLQRIIMTSLDGRDTMFSCLQTNYQASKEKAHSEWYR